MTMTVSKMKDIENKVDNSLNFTITYPIHVTSAIENDMNDTGTILRSKAGKDVHIEPIHVKKTEVECQNGH